MSDSPRGPETFTELERVRDLSLSEFRRKYLRAGRPVILEGHARSWPALRKWSISQFRSRTIAEALPAKVGDQGTDDQRCLAVEFGDYLRELEEAPEAAARSRVYLSNLDLFSHFPELKADADFSWLNGSKLWIYQRMHIGPAGTVTGYHFDCADNLLVQIEGSKTVRLIDRRFRREMYPKPLFKYFTRMSQVDPLAFDPKRHPLFDGVPAFVGRLQPGDAVFIPKRWWHHVVSHSNSITFANWGMSLGDLLTDGLPETGRRWLHGAGLYRRGACTCHRFEMTRGKQF